MYSCGYALAVSALTSRSLMPSSSTGTHEKKMLKPWFASSQKIFWPAQPLKMAYQKSEPEQSTFL